MKWYIKRKPTGISFFRDEFPYLDYIDEFGGSMWTKTRKEVYHPFESLVTASVVITHLRKTDPDLVIVRVK